MKRLVCCTAVALVTGTLAASLFAQDARALPIVISSENTADFTLATEPTSSTNPTVSSSSPVVYAPGAAGTITGSSSSQFRSPFENAATPGSGVGNWASLAYSSVEAGASATYTFADSNTLSILWGSPDTYNTLEFLLSGTPIESFTGADLAINTVGHDQLTFTDTVGQFNEVILTSQANAFEFADMTFTNTSLPTPIPGALPLFASGLGALGMLGWRRKKKNQPLRIAAV